MKKLNVKDILLKSFNNNIRTIFEKDWKTLNKYVLIYTEKEFSLRIYFESYGSCGTMQPSKNFTVTLIKILL